MSEQQTNLISRAKDLENQMGDFINELFSLQKLNEDEEPNVIDPRTLAVARTNLQTSFMWLVRAIEQPESNL